MGDRPIAATGVHCGGGARCRRQEVAMIDPAFTLEKKAAIVVGAANGIGRATALAFAAAGARVACADLEEPGAKATAADSDKTATVLEMDEAAWDRVIRINLTGAFLMVKAAIPAMIARGGGSVILIASQLGRVAAPGRPAYCATKGALIQLAKVLAADHAAQGIRANTISPGAIETRRMLRRHKDMDEARKVMGPKHLLGRLGLPEEIARAALYLASDASAFMTGSDLLIDGGYTAI